MEIGPSKSEAIAPQYAHTKLVSLWIMDMKKIRSNEGVKQRFGITNDATYVPINVFKFPKGFNSDEDDPKTLQTSPLSQRMDKLISLSKYAFRLLAYSLD